MATPQRAPPTAPICALGRGGDSQRGVFYHSGNLSLAWRQRTPLWESQLSGTSRTERESLLPAGPRTWGRGHRHLLGEMGQEPLGPWWRIPRGRQGAAEPCAHTLALSSRGLTPKGPCPVPGVSPVPAWSLCRAGGPGYSRLQTQFLWAVRETPCPSAHTLSRWPSSAARLRPLKSLGGPGQPPAGRGLEGPWAPRSGVLGHVRPDSRFLSLGPRASPLTFRGLCLSL